MNSEKTKHCVLDLEGGIKGKEVDHHGTLNGKLHGTSTCILQTCTPFVHFCTHNHHAQHCAHVRKYCRACIMLQNAYLVATVGFDMAENEPSEVWETSRILRRLSVGGGRLPEFQLFRKSFNYVVLCCITFLVISRGLLL